jgi:hypothetical protein
MIGEDAPLLDHLATLGVQQAEMAVAVADVDAGGNVVVVLGHGRSPPSCGSALDLRSSTCVIVGFARSIISAFSSHLDRGYARSWIWTSENIVLLGPSVSSNCERSTP